MFDIYKVIFEIYNKDKLVNKQIMEAPKEILIMNFLQTVNQIAEDQRPLKVKMIRPETIWDNFENKQKILNNEIEFSNNAMLAWEENKWNER